MMKGGGGGAFFRVAQGGVGELVVDPAGSLPVGVRR
jgi:hypothetical protein